MKLVLNNNSTAHQNSATCTAYEYNTGEPAINGARITLTGRYPETGTAFNTVSKELVYVLQGEGRAIVQGQPMALAPGDQLLIEPNETYYFDGTMELFIACTPAWKPEQHQYTD